MTLSDPRKDDVRSSAARDDRRDRLASVDALRGVAVLLMVAWHCAHAWLEPSARLGIAGSVLRVAGGMAAPLFVWLAGLSVGLSLERGSDRWTIARRGLETIVLGWLLRLQLWLVDGGAALEPRAWPALVAGLAGCAIAWHALRRGPLRALPVALACLALAAWRVHVDVPAHAAMVLRVDVLSCIGASIVICAWAAARPLGALTLASAIVLLTPLAQSQIDGLDAPAWTAWLARAADGSNRSMAGFPLLPWLAYALVGAASVRAIQRAPIVALVASGLLVAALGFEGGLPWTRRLLHDAPWLRPCARLLFHVGAATAALGLARAIGERLPRALRELGRASLPVYWAHVALVFGVASAPLHHALGPRAWAVATGATGVLAALGARAWTRRRSLGARLAQVLQAPTSSSSPGVSAPNSRA